MHPERRHGTGHRKRCQVDKCNARRGGFGKRKIADLLSKTFETQVLNIPSLDGYLEWAAELERNADVSNLRTQFDIACKKWLNGFRRDCPSLFFKCWLAWMNSANAATKLSSYHSGAHFLRQFSPHLGYHVEIPCTAGCSGPFNRLCALCRKKVKKIANRELHKGGNGLKVGNIEGVDVAADAEVNGGGDFTGRVQDNADAATPTGSSSLPSRPPFGCDTSPLADIDLLRKARQSAQAEAEASGNGKRPKTPSRKALEASGVAGVVQDAPQLMTKEIREALAPKTARRTKDQRPRIKGDCKRNCFTGQATGDVAGSGSFTGKFGGNGFSRISAAGEDTSPSSEEILEEYLQQRRQHQQQQTQHQQNQQRQQQQSRHLKRKTQRQQQQRSASLRPHQGKSSNDTTTAVSAPQCRRVDAAPTRGAGNVDTKKTTNTNKRRGGVTEKNRDMKAKKMNTSINGELRVDGKECVVVAKAATLCAFEDCKAGATYGVNNTVRYWYVVRFTYLPL